MESLYRKYRPQTFDDVVGQQHVVSTLEHAVLEGRTSHAYLFCGPRGTGKTTMARLLAKALLCEQGPGRLPDGTCEQCQLIAAGEHPDVYELDAASRTGVDNVREEIISRVSFAPVRGSHKVYIIDEVHMLTTAAFNALLKTLEEPPSHVVFVLCTTDPQKVPETILSRVQRFDFHAISNEELLARLIYVCEQEGFGYDRAALDLVCRHARGGMRDALSTLEQLSVFGDGQITMEAASDLLGEVRTTTLSSIALALAARDVPTLFGEVATLVDAGRDLLRFTRELAAHLRDVYVVAVVGPRKGVINAADAELPELAAQAQAFGSSDRLSRALSILADASNEMRTATNQRLVLELAFTRIARPTSDLTLESLAERIGILEQQMQSLVAMSRSMATASALASPAAMIQGRVSLESGKEGPTARIGVSGSADASGPQPPQPSSVAQPPQPPQHKKVFAEQGDLTGVSDESGSNRGVGDLRQAPVQDKTSNVSAYQSRGAITSASELQRRWRQVVDYLQSTSPSRGSLLMNSTLESDDGSRLIVKLQQNYSFLVKMLIRKDISETVDCAVAKIIGIRHISYRDARVPDPKSVFLKVPPQPASVPSKVPPQPASVPSKVPPQPAPEVYGVEHYEDVNPDMYEDAVVYDNIDKDDDSESSYVTTDGTLDPIQESAQPSSRSTGYTHATATPLSMLEAPASESVPSGSTAVITTSTDTPIAKDSTVTQYKSSLMSPITSSSQQDSAQPAKTDQVSQAAQPAQAATKPPRQTSANFDPNDPASVMALVSRVFGEGVKDISNSL